MDKAKVDEAVREFANALPEPPKWVILLKEEDGELLSHTGNFRDTYLTSLTPDEAARLIHSLAVTEIEMTDALKHGNFQFSYHGGGIGAYWIVVIHGGYLLGISYQGRGVRSLNAVADGIIMHFRIILEAIYPLWN